MIISHSYSAGGNKKRNCTTSIQCDGQKRPNVSEKELEICLKLGHNTLTVITIDHPICKTRVYTLSHGPDRVLSNVYNSTL